MLGAARRHLLPPQHATRSAAQVQPYLPHHHNHSSSGVYSVPWDSGRDASGAGCFTGMGKRAERVATGGERQWAHEHGTVSSKVVKQERWHTRGNSAARAAVSHTGAAADVGQGKILVGQQPRPGRARCSAQSTARQPQLTEHTTQLQAPGRRWEVGRLQPQAGRAPLGLRSTTQMLTPHRRVPPCWSALSSASCRPARGQPDCECWG